MRIPLAAVQRRSTHFPAVQRTPLLPTRSPIAKRGGPSVFSQVGDRARAYDVIIDTAGNRPLSLPRRAATPHGTIALVGGGTPRARILGGFQRQMAAPLISLFMSQRLCGGISRVRAGELEDLTGLIEAGKIIRCR